MYKEFTYFPDYLSTKNGCSTIPIFVRMKNEYSIAVQAALEAGQAIMEVYGTGDFGIEVKADHSPLTLADKRAHEIIVSHLAATSLPVLSEEGQHTPYGERSAWKCFWLVDPLDGTKEFISRNGEFTVNIALVEETKAVFGVVYAPVINELYVGIPGRGAFRCQMERNFKQPLDYLLQFAEQLPLEMQDEDRFRVVASRSHYNEETRKYVESIDSGGREISLVNKGSSLKICMVASGEAQLYPRMGPTMEWDTAAAHAVVKASGKNVYRSDNGEELHYNKQNLLNPFFVVK
jgi:3'(2'), 5'-bisphosphate nucleotidase